MGSTGKIKVYRASAGSGKTFRLALEYMKIVIKNPDKYKNILAVTFTNKATEEMKERILEQLYGLANNLESSKGYMDCIAEETGMPEPVISENAGIALWKIMHDYSGFQITTIDSFFQRVMRQMARELKLPANLGVDLNTEKIIDEAVDRLFQVTGENGVTKVSNEWNLIKKYVEEQTNNYKNWDVRNEVKEVAKSLAKEEYKEKRLETETAKKMDDRFWEEYKKALEERRRTVTNDFWRAVEGLDELVTSDDGKAWKTKDGREISQRSSAGYYLAGIRGKLKNAEEPDWNGQNTLEEYKNWDATEKWIKGAKGEDLVFAEQELMPKLAEISKKQAACRRTVNSVELSTGNLYGLRLLRKIEEIVREIAADRGVTLLSDTQSLLGDMLTKGDGIFIYEKLGTWIEHVMIDEFQDTSKTQWRNFIVLLDECIASGKDCLIVGDVKQSIYRWRGGDWQLLGKIGKEGGDYAGQIDDRTLDTNYRSSKDVVKFNNAFFPIAVEERVRNEKNQQLADEIREAYKDVGQKIKKTDLEGEVKVMFVGNEEQVTGEDGDDNTYDIVIKRTADKILELMRNGVMQRKIAVLTRKNKTIKALAAFVDENREAYGEIRLVSGEAFMLKNSLAVRTLVSAMRYITSSKENLENAEAELAQNIRQAGNNERIESNENMLRSRDKSAMLPKELVEQKSKIASLPVHDMAETLYRILLTGGKMQVSEESLYVSKFMDVIDDYFSDFTMSVRSFCRDWDEKKIGETSVEKDAGNGVRVMTVHKSKGLEFENVIIPMTGLIDDGKGRHNEMIWCEPEEEPYAEARMLGITYGKKMESSIYEKDYVNEKMQKAIDELNGIYVALTRAGRNLYVIGDKAKLSDKGELKSTEDLFYNVISQVTGEDEEKETPELNFQISGTIDGDGDYELTFAENIGRAFETEDKKNKDKEKEEQNVLVKLRQTKPLSVTFNSNKIGVTTRQSNDSKRFVDSEEGGFLEQGTIMHAMLADIETVDDVDMVAQRFLDNGVMRSEKEKNTMVKRIKKGLEKEKIADWFSGKWTLRTECWLLTRNAEGTTEYKRPDRVMISADGKKAIVVDYKLAKDKDDGSYHEQVKTYMEAMKSMGYEEVEGYLWFVMTNKELRIKD